ncbi:MAG TPA: thiamine pyrophosphate-dependent dehydrogenase E1 component subunit alpha [Candidatus Dormibacteraeota bacterium]|nr:thiamine pyrophosphate-dependent dehydrogenase E1 component subunit alpha [Candidatus Dormibacteraeota bacterium]
MTADFRENLLRDMIRIRRVEETLADLYPSQEMRTPTHFSIGQEAAAVGVCAALRHNDVVYSGHRCHAHYLAKGGDLRSMVAELYGRETGCARGRGGSVHLNDPGAGVIASSAILGQTMAVAVGTALAFTMDGCDRVAATFFGDGTVEEGIFHETLNFAVMRRAPVLFVCENNGFSTHTRLDVRQPASVSIHARAASYGMPSRLVDGNDVFAVSEAAREAVAHARRGAGPFFLECTTYRWREHVGPLWDYDKGYRTKAEVDSWIARCPIRRASERLLSEGVCTPERIAAMVRASQLEVDEAVAAARAASFPAVEDLTLGTY